LKDDRKKRTKTAKQQDDTNNGNIFYYYAYYALLKLSNAYFALLTEVLSLWTQKHVTGGILFDSHWT
jgi:hypothetical protein